MTHSSYPRAVSKLKREDTNKNGRIGWTYFLHETKYFRIPEYSEWVTFYHKHIRDARALFPAFQVLLYQPQYSCHPPVIFILMFSVLQVTNYSETLWPTFRVRLSSTSGTATLSPAWSPTPSCPARPRFAPSSSTTPPGAAPHYE